MPDARELLSDEPEMESTQHYQQRALLVSYLKGLLYETVGLWRGFPRLEALDL